MQEELAPVRPFSSLREADLARGRARKRRDARSRDAGRAAAGCRRGRARRPPRPADRGRLGYPLVARPQVERLGPECHGRSRGGPGPAAAGTTSVAEAGRRGVRLGRLGAVGVAAPRLRLPAE